MAPKSVRPQEVPKTGRDPLGRVKLPALPSAVVQHMPCVPCSPGGRAIVRIGFEIILLEG